MVLLRLFIVFLKIGAFSFGGGYAMLPLIEKEIVYSNRWLTHKEFIDIIAVSQMSPGPIAVNTATFVGFREMGTLGAVAATIGIVFISFVSVILLAKIIIRHSDSDYAEGIFYGLRPAVIGLIASACITLFRTSIVDIKSIIIGLLVLVSLYKFKTNPIIILLCSGILGIVIYSI